MVVLLWFSPYNRGCSETPQAGLAIMCCLPVSLLQRHKKPCNIGQMGGKPSIWPSWNGFLWLCGWASGCCGWAITFGGFLIRCWGGYRGCLGQCLGLYVDRFCSSTQRENLQGSKNPTYEYWSGVEWSGYKGQKSIKHRTPNIDPNSLYNHPNTDLKSLQK